MNEKDILINTMRAYQKMSNLPITFDEWKGVVLEKNRWPNSCFSPLEQCMRYFYLGFIGALDCD